MKLPRLALLPALLVTLLGAPASGQQFDVQAFNPGPSQTTNYLGVGSAEILRAQQWEVGLLLNYADHPLVLREAGTNDRVRDIVSGQLTANVLAAVGLFDRLEIGIDIPVILQQNGDVIGELANADGDQGGAGVGDIRVVPTINLFDANRRNGETGGAALSITSDLYLPTGNDDDWQGEPFRAHPQVIFDYALRNHIRFTVGAGVMIRHTSQLLNLRVDDAITYHAAVDIPINRPDTLHLIVEAEGGATISGDLRGDTEERPLEARVGARYFTPSGVVITGGLGAGVIEGAGMPNVRALFGVAYASRPSMDRDGDGLPNNLDGCPNEPEDMDLFQDDDGCPDPDNDRDGIRDIHDECPLDPEDFDEFEDADGCPDLDNDQDGVLDDMDACPLEPEDVDAFEDTDGCPDLDNDGDGILDADDGCPNLPEDFDNFEDADGCADPDNDRDGRPDVTDVCPNEPEDFDGFEDDDGCPEEGAGLVSLQCDSIDILDNVHFDTNSDVIQSRSYELLDQVAELLTGLGAIRRVRVEGHTDNRGADDYNLDLSQRRAGSVQRYLVDRGVEADRLEAQGYGETIPIADNGRADGRAENRRVEFRILERDDANCAE